MLHARDGTAAQAAAEAHIDFIDLTLGQMREVAARQSARSGGVGG